MGQKQTVFDTKLKAKEWSWQLKTEMKGIDREIKKIAQAQAKIQKEIQEQAAAGNVSGVQMLATHVVRSKKAIERLERTKLSMKGVELQVTTAVATMGTATSIQLSNDVMKSMNAFARTPELGAVMESMRKEMQTCAAAEDGMEEALKTDGESDAAATEVQKVLDEMALNQMGPLAAAAAAAALPPMETPAVAAPPQKQAILAGGGPAPKAAPPKPAPAPVIEPPKPGESLLPGGPMDLDALIKDVYRRHNPEKLPEIDKILKQHGGSRMDFYIKVCEKYGETPSGGGDASAEIPMAQPYIPGLVAAIPVGPDGVPMAQPYIPVQQVQQPPPQEFQPPPPAAPAAAAGYPPEAAAAPPASADDDLMARLANLKG